MGIWVGLLGIELVLEDELSEGVRDGIEQVRKVLKERYDWNGKFEYVHHGTTTATNAVLEGKGAKCGLVVTKGHRDILNVRRSHIPGGLGAWINYEQPEPLVPVERTVEARNVASISLDSNLEEERKT